MTHSIKVKAEVEYSVEVKIPSYWKHGSSFYAIIDVDNVYEVLPLTNFCAIHSGTLESMSSNVRSAMLGEEIDENDFFEAYNKARKTQELKSTLSYYAGDNGIEKEVTHY